MLKNKKKTDFFYLDTCTYTIHTYIVHALMASFSLFLIVLKLMENAPDFSNTSEKSRKQLKF